MVVDDVLHHVCVAGNDFGLLVDGLDVCEEFEQSLPQLVLGLFFLLSPLIHGNFNPCV